MEVRKRDEWLVVEKIQDTAVGNAFPPTGRKLFVLNPVEYGFSVI